ncbi:LLM class flavin-dependent oxidoreductase [Mycobacterium deserti]|uniref:LLM class flavin-dependent oxidoreductase n=1 Tax=Mycobacterium deserti TaxID=2978347 RepID=A0ABT2MKA3_9MYCO|nr:LLM class flavin-dependent oxidoreductase [Mycobacterium deserti]MCT7661411.1 LLM class flavin-dependent oxidoreductase [Mycobacterium deserti]
MPIQDRTPLKFGVLLYPDDGLLDLPRQFRWLEDLGFDQVLVPDHSSDLRDRSRPWFDGWSVLPLGAAATERIRIGTLVSNPILRPAATLARQALTVDHLSGGRLDLGIGAGLFDWDHHAVGEQPWSPKERAGRFADYVAILDGILRGDGEPFTHDGDWLQARDVATVPGSVQRPRPTLMTGGQSPTVLRVSAERADVWNTIGPIVDDPVEILEVTARQNAKLDELCRAAGRDPLSLRRSFTPFGPYDIWTGGATLEQVVEQFGAIGMTEFVFDLPPKERRSEFEHLATEVIPALRGSVPAKTAS